MVGLLIRVNARVGNVEAGFSLLREMRAKGFEPEEFQISLLRRKAIQQGVGVSDLPLSPKARSREERRKGRKKRYRMPAQKLEHLAMKPGWTKRGPRAPPGS